MRSPVRIALILSLILCMSVFGQQRPAPRSAVPAAARAVSNATAITSSANAPAIERRLPVRRVVLYKNGVGYFEHVGRVHGAQDVTIDFTSAQLNDVLKSLTALDLGGGRVTGVAYNSDAPLARRLGALRLPLGERTSLQQFLDALRGAKLEIRNGAAVFTGRLLSVERKTRVSGGTTLEVDYLSLITDSGEVRTLELTPQINLRLAERDLGGEVSRYLDLISSTRAQDLRRMTIATTGTGERPLFVSYISEVPVWKTTYRLVLPSKPGAKPLLQGWAIVDNTVGEDWNNVELSLVAGAPQSFIQQLSQPYYSRRPVVALPEALQLTPQTHQATLVAHTGQIVGEVTDSTGAAIANSEVVLKDHSGGTVVARQNTNEDGEYVLDSLPVGKYTLEVSAAGFKKAVIANVEVRSGQQNEQDVELDVGTVSSTITVEAVNEFSIVAPPAPLMTPQRILTLPFAERNLSEAAGLAPGISLSQARADFAQAQARAIGDLFEYTLKEPVTIRKNQSAMAPIVNAEIVADQVSLWSEGLGTPRPLRGVWLTNTSSLTLDGGSFSVLDNETFAGEGLLETIKPGEKRLLTYARDLGVVVSSVVTGEQKPVRRVAVSHGVMTTYTEEQSTKTYTINNEDQQSRAVVIEHPARAEWKFVKGTPEPEETSPDAHRFRVMVKPKETATLRVEEYRPIESRIVIASTSDEQVNWMVATRSINEEIESALRSVLEQKKAIALIVNELNAAERENRRIFDDQQRLRENIKALKGSAEEKELLQRYTRQLNSQENRLEELRKLTEQLQTKRAAAQAQLEKMIQDLSLDVTL